MSIERWDPWKELERLRAHTDQLWDNFLGKLTESAPHATAAGLPTKIQFMPDVDFVEMKNEFRVFVSLPGAIEEDIEISTSPTELTIRGERESPYDTNREHVREWRYGYFERSLRLPSEIAADQVRATYDAGVLTIVLPKRDEKTSASPTPTQNDTHQDEAGKGGE